MRLVKDLFKDTYLLFIRVDQWHLRIALEARTNSHRNRTIFNFTVTNIRVDSEKIESLRWTFFDLPCLFNYNISA